MKKKKIMIIGSRGMAGHTIYEYLDSLNKYDLSDIAREKLTWKTLCLDVLAQGNYLERVIDNVQPDIIINCAGILIKDSEEKNLEAIAINASFPYVLADMTKHLPTKIIHLSTDCVFKGDKGDYNETDTPNGKGMYAITKALGELNDGKNLTLRLSIIGDELKENGSGLFQWFMKQKGIIKGYARAWWNGITTLELAKQIDRIIDTKLTGIYHLAPDFVINKYQLLHKIAITFNHITSFVPDNSVVQNKTLKNNRKKEYNPKIPYYDTQLREMRKWIRGKLK